MFRRLPRWTKTRISILSLRHSSAPEAAASIRGRSAGTVLRGPRRTKTSCRRSTGRVQGTSRVAHQIRFLLLRDVCPERRVISRGPATSKPSISTGSQRLWRRVVRNLRCEVFVGFSGIRLSIWCFGRYTALGTALLTDGCELSLSHVRAISRRRVHLRGWLGLLLWG
jgi:hypothetical protein